MSAHKDRVVLFQGDNGRWHWRYQAAGNWATLADSGQGQGYATKDDALVGAARVTHCVLVESSHPDIDIEWVLPLYVRERS